MVILILALGFGCARVPPEAVVLSDTVGKDLAGMQAAHASLVRQYFGSMRNRAEAFVNDVYRPFIIRRTMEELNLVEEIQRAARGEGDLDSLDIMEIYAEEAIAQIESFRAELLDPINQQEQALLNDLDASYAAMRNANAVITAHLRSVRRVHETQAELLSQVGLPADFREQISGRAAAFSGQVNKLLLEARSADEKLDQLPEKIRELGDRF